MSSCLLAHITAVYTEKVNSYTLIHIADVNKYFKKVTITYSQGVTKICPLSQLNNSAFVYEPKFGGRGVRCGVSANDYS
jgi:hypothetical protein